MDHAANKLPAVGWESRDWDRPADRAMSRRQQLSARGPYQAAIPTAIADIQITLEAVLQAEAEDAIRAIARFDAELGAMADRRTEGPHQGSTELAPLTSVLLRTESASSSQIEGVTAGARALALAAIEAKSGPNARLVTANVEAMRRAVDLADDISTDSLLAAHAALLGEYEYAAPGRFRDGQVWIGSNAMSPHSASFVPPHPELVDQAMTDLIQFVRRADLPVLAHIAIAHAQFETIHPFNDGNGRVGRTLVHAMLRSTDVTRHLTVPVSAGLLTDTTAYFDALTEYRVGNAEPIIRQFINASFRAVDNGRQLINELDGIYRDWEERLPSRHGSAARRLLPTLLNQPAINIAYVVTTLGVANSAAQRAVEQLERADVISRSGGGQRNRVWIAGDVIEALDSFARRAGRRL